MFPDHSKGDVWFSDGNIILLTAETPTAFKVHRGVLARHSEIFQNMLDVPQPTSQAEMLEGCPVLPMHDLPVELAHLVKALYDGPDFAARQASGIESFFYIAAILRLATKYFIKPLRLSAIRALQQIWANSLKGHDEMVTKAIEAPIIDGMTYPYHHPLHAVNLALETHVSVVIPSALYFLSLYPLEDLLRADHPKLAVDHPSKPSSEIPQQIMKDYILMYQKRIDLILDFVRQFCGERCPCPSCTQSKSCTRAFARLSSRFGRSWMPRTGPLHYMVQAQRQFAEDPTACASCKRAFSKDTTALRERIWRELPSYAGFSQDWERLEASDLSD